MSSIVVVSQTVCLSAWLRAGAGSVASLMVSGHSLSAWHLLALGHLALPTILELASLFLKHLFHKLSEDSGLAWIANILDTEINQALHLISHPALEDPLSLSLRVSQVTHLSLSTWWHESWGPATP